MNAKNQMLSLQVGQIRHDAQFHKDIINLSTPKRVTHMVLHFAKYLGKFVTAKKLGDSELFEKTLVDTVIIALGTANALDVALHEQINDDLSVHPDLLSFSKTLSQSKRVDDELCLDYLLDNMPIIVGEMAKACESLDHLEDFNAREILNYSIVSLMKCLLVTSTSLSNELMRLISERWNEIEQSYPLRADFESVMANVKINE